MQRLLVDHEGELLEALAADLGKPATEAYATELGFVGAELKNTLRHLRRWMRPQRVSTGLAVKPARARIVREPLGVVLVIAPWNYPVNLLLGPMIGAIAAGNCVVAKPSELTPHTSAVLARRIPEYLDPDCVAVVEGGTPECGLLLDQRFDHIFFTGSNRVARVVMEAAARHLTPVTLELGGKSPAIVDGTANLEVAGRRVAWGKFLNAGQTCIAPDYVLVTEGVADRFVEEVRRSIFDFYGPDPQASPDYARIVDDRHYARLVGLLDSGTVGVGGEHDAASRFIAPTVLRDVAADSPAMQDEIFGPILPVLTVGSIDEAIAFVNERDKPLALYVFTGSADVATARARRDQQRRRVRERHDVPPGGPGPAVRWRRPERYRLVPRTGVVRHVQPRQERAAQATSPRPGARVPAVHQAQGLAHPAVPMTEVLADGWGRSTPRDDTLTARVRRVPGRSRRGHRRRARAPHRSHG